MTQLLTRGARAMLAVVLLACGLSVAAGPSYADSPQQDVIVQESRSYAPGTPDPGDDDGGYQLDGVQASWYAGHQFQHRKICLESAWANAPLNTVALEWRDLNNSLLVPYVRMSAGGCGASGFPPAQRIVYHTYSTADGLCGHATTTYSASTGFNLATDVYINLHSSVSSCRTGTSWTSTYLHETGHTLGLAHTPVSETDSVMHAVNDGINHPSPTWERPRIASIYTGNPL